MTRQPDEITVSGPLTRALHANLADAPDLVPPLAAAAASLKAPSRFEGVSHLRAKESDRLTALVTELGRVGCAVASDGDLLEVRGPIREAARLATYADHRMAMAAALFGAAGAPVEIEGAEAVAKSYPGFFDDLEALGVKIQVVAG